MAHIKHTTNKSMRRVLRREVPSTVGLLADEQDFAAMTGYRSFVFDDHAAYLLQVEDLLRSLAAQGVHTTVALFDPEEFLEFCESTGLDPDTPVSRTRFIAELAICGASVPYSGQPIDRLVPLLINEAVRQATWEYATLLLADLGNCAECGMDIGRESFDRASRLVLRLLEAAGSGTHHLVCSIPAEEARLLAVLHAERAGEQPVRPTESESAEFVTVLAAGLAMERPGGVVLRTTGPGEPDRLRGWRLNRGSLVALSAGEVFSAYCTDADTGDPVSPEPGVEYCPGFDVEDPEPHH
ncbi:hypothetical protein [Streptomyces sp. H27-C3]|uniref:hypothetical protein n=1 Tax=Streptomyces sp. H27-C3 TaxID=3046305 RepID=UPI0024BB6BE1|nr:hypothetical protein [Streptomyces sp. H27-C3]MDJ0465845.1 hypothetical protein [Streptomyces sp. H27-C3]